ncbi:MAG: hypothetical protein AB7T27_01915 [Kiritimatiellia bacterium]
MKRVFYAYLCLFSQLGLAQHYVPTKATITVRDDIGQLVKHVSIEGGFRDFSNAGSRDRFMGVTDANGVFIAKGQALIGVGVRATAEGYYETITSVPLDMKKGMQMDHWNVTVPVVLKRIRNPISMYSREVENPYISAFEGIGRYRLIGASRYDFVKGDFLSPYGNGSIADLDYNWKMTIHSTNKVGRALDKDMHLEIRMTNVLDGICKGNADGGKGNNGNEGSSYISAYEAPAEGYTNNISLYWKVRGMKAESNDDQHSLYYFRIRTQTSETGQVTNALYGKIYGQINGTFTYYLNPTPNDRNVEFDPQRNLFAVPPQAKDPKIYEE